jgi:hypothetical protein
MHVVNQDTQLMAFADLTSRITGLLSMTGQLLLLINLPLLRTHPPTDERVERLMALTHMEGATADVFLSPWDIRSMLAHNPYRPRWHRNGMWY